MLGKTLSFPFSADRRGTLGTTRNDDEIIANAILDIIETRQGERVMILDYGLPDLVFDPLDVTFAPRLAFLVEEQIKNYLTAVENVRVESGLLTDGTFAADPFPTEPHKAAIRVTWTKRGESLPQELIYPTWRLAE
jgi:phage baseplate assembly protein W